MIFIIRWPRERVVRPRPAPSFVIPRHYRQRAIDRTVMERGV